VPGRLAGKVALITGAARGQGEAEARLFAAEGARVVLGDVLSDQVAAVAADIGPDRAIAMAMDVTVAADWQAALSAAEETFGGLDILINNAAIHWIRAIVDEDPDDVLRLLGVNLVGPLLGIKLATPLLAARPGGAIVSISSLAGHRGPPGHAAYGASKWGLRGVMKVAAVELGPLGIRVNTILPGPIETMMLPPDPTGQPDRFGYVPLGRAGQPSEVAETALFLASDAAAYITGAEIAIDGGSSTGQVDPSKRPPRATPAAG
jgi:3alpha(or 20beta)-hydroxysteroid dehydrogenase